MATACSSLHTLTFLPSVKLQNRPLSIPAPFSLPRNHKTRPQPRLRPLSFSWNKHLPYSALSSTDGDKPRVEGGIFGIYGDHEAARLCYGALLSLQHRGLGGAGIVSLNDGVLKSITGPGLVSDVFDESALNQLPGNSAIGHVYNGSLVNYADLCRTLGEIGSIPKIIDACEQIRGAYSFVLLTKDDKLVAVRDPHGFRPLVMGTMSNGAIVFASETRAFQVLDAEFEREVLPGEIVVVDKTGVHSEFFKSPPTPKQCIFELISLSWLTSDVFGRSVSESRHRFGEILATLNPVDCDVVVPVPVYDSDYTAAVGYAAKAGVPLHFGSSQGKRVVVVVDSMVRGSTATTIVRTIRGEGAKEVHMRVASPPITGPCYYGVAIPSSEELIANRKSVEEIREYIGADSLGFLPLDALREAMGSNASNYCYGCFSGEYPVLPEGLNH